MRYPVSFKPKLLASVFLCLRVVAGSADFDTLGAF